MTAQKPERAPHTRPRVPARDEAASADGSTDRAPHGTTPPMSELLASCAAAAAVSRPPSDAEESDSER
ncbi:hypothetical protein [Streptomyces sp. 3N207]|uniref:hypothetical protein n=1 Tax=Streptomyces sp. 3N207 TaxID=3457417 RepID=UPI003FD48F9F